MAERKPAVDHEAPLLSADSTPAEPISTAPSTAVKRSSSRRITRSSARQAAGKPNDGSPAQEVLPDGTLDPPSTVIGPSATKSTATGVSRKRKVSPKSKDTSPASQSKSSSRRPKRQKIPEAGKDRLTAEGNVSGLLKSGLKGKTPTSMDDSDRLNIAGSSSSARVAANSTSRKSNRSKKTTQDQATTSSSSSTRRSKRTIHQGPEEDTTMSGTDEHQSLNASSAPSADEDPAVGQDRTDEADMDEDANAAHRRFDEEEDEEDDDPEDDPFSGFGPPGAMSGLSSTLQALTGMMSGFSSRLRDLLNSLRQDDASVQLIALQELSELLLVSNEDNLSGHFSPDAFVKELVVLLSKDDQPEIMLLACRCLANMMEALPASVANVVYGNAVPVLCQKLLEISFIDLAEQALSTLEKISVDYPSSIVREGGLTACLSYLDFFATSTQRTAVTTAANCCRNISEDSFPVVRDVMPILLNVLNSSDQRVVEKASLCVTGIVESFKYHSVKLEQLVSVELLRAILRLLVPGTTNLIGSSIHTQFLRVLAFIARASPQLSAELFKLNVVETLYQILTGVSPPTGFDDVASKLDSVVIMQALIHRPRDQIIETLNVICELLPGLPRGVEPALGDFAELPILAEPMTLSSTSGRGRRSDKRLELLSQCKPEVRRFVLIILPTLTDAFSSTVNLSVRQKVLTAQLKMLSNLDTQILIEALVPVPYASFLASILSQRDHSSLVMLALQAAELLLSRLGDIYRYQFYREGVIHEINKLAIEEDEPKPSPSATKPEDVGRSAQAGPSGESDHSPTPAPGHGEDEDAGDDTHESSHDDEDDDDEDEDDEGMDDMDDEPHPDDISPVSSRGSTMSLDAPSRRSVSSMSSMNSRIRKAAKRFIETHENEDQIHAMKSKALGILKTLSGLAEELEKFFLDHSQGATHSTEAGKALFVKLASHFDTDVLESVTSAELLESGLVRVLLAIFSNSEPEAARLAHSMFLEVFMGRSLKSKPKTATADSPATPLSVMIHKLQDLLSRSEHFEVLTVHHNTFDGNRSSPASMLGKQIRLRLVGDEESNIPRSYRNIMVSIHAIATFKALDDYLRPRISLTERPRNLARREGLSRALAALAGSHGLPLNSAAARFGDRSPFTGLAAPPPPPPAASASPSTSRTARKSNSRSLPQPDAAMTSEQGDGPSREKAVLRRSSRRNAAATDTSPDSRPPPVDDDDVHSTLECADEKQLTDDDEMDESSALDAVVDQLEDEGVDDDEAPSDPTAVNMEVASGGSITARKEDGTRVPTPGGSSLVGRGIGAAPPDAGSQPSPASRPMSYASAVQAVPQDWHIEFRLDGKVIPLETTIYRAVHASSVTNSEDNFMRNIWSATHSINFRRVAGPPPPENLSVASSLDPETEAGEQGMPASLAKHPNTASILRLLKILHDLNANIEDVLVEESSMAASLNVEPLSQFVNTKLTAKLNRQLEEPLIVASNCMPSWAEDLARLFPFLYPFETRHLFLQSTSFGYARSMARWQSTQTQEDSRRDRHNDRPFLGRLQRQKVRIARHKILESALKVMDLYGASQSILEVEYFDEVGTGLGPTLEFYSTVSKEFSKKKLKLWREADSVATGDFVSGQIGLFPRPLSPDETSTANGERILHLFKMLGKFVARSMIDSRIIDLHFNPIFFRIGDAATTGVKPSLGAVKAVDPSLARSLKTIKKFSLAKKDIDEDPSRNAAQKVADVEAITIDGVTLEDLCLDFTLPGFPDIELLPNGPQMRVTIENVDSYLDKVIDMTLGTGVRQQVDAFRAGFSQVFPYSALSAFTPDELVTLFGRVDEDWSIETLLDSLKADHGYNMDSRSVRNLLQVMGEMDMSQRRDFLQFTTGSPKLPIGGFRSLTPMFTVVCKPSEHPYTSDDYLPSVMTCVNYLKLPDYTSLAAMRKQLFTAIREGQGAFHLS